MSSGQTLYCGQSLRADLSTDAIVTLCFDRHGESVNKFDSATVSELAAAAAAIAACAGAKGLLVTSAKPAFIVGADIFEFAAMFTRSEASLRAHVAQQNEAFSAFDDLPVPSVAVINGLALGGGFEMALACDARVMSSEAQLSLPEVSLGLIPGFGGTVRLPRLVGMAAALEWITSGGQQNAAKSLAVGAVDEVASPHALGDAGMLRLRQMIDSGDWRAKRALRRGPVATAPEALERTRSALERTASHQPAALAAVDLLERAASCSRDRSLALENEAFARIARTQAAASLTQLFVNDQRIRKRARSYAKTALKVNRAAVLGAGIMGGGIAFTSASRGIPVIMKDIAATQLQSGMAELDRLLARQVDSRRMSMEQSRIARESVQATLEFEGFEQVDIVIEAVVENLAVKQRVLGDVEARITPDTVIASNTSSLSIADMARELGRPANFLGMHFFNPVPAMPLVEVIRGPATGDQAVATAVAYASSLGKTSVVVRECPGFLVNRILTPYMLAFLRAVSDGADFQQVDRVMQAFGWPMGPAHLQDVIGMDTLEHVLNVISSGYPQRMCMDFVNTAQRLVRGGRLGQKSGVGWYRYELDEQGKRRKVFDPAVTEVLAAEIKDAPAMTDAVMLDRLMLPMILEAALCLEERVVDTPAEVDSSLVLGLGFPRYAGGPLKLADWLGADEVIRRCEAFSSLGPLYRPGSLLRDMARAGSSFYSLDAVA